MQKLIELLNQARLITTRANTMMLEKQKRGEYFNIFEVLNLAHYEEKLHTPFITELLNPQGSHGLKDSFLRAFIR